MSLIWSDVWLELQASQCRLLTKPVSQCFCRTGIPKYWLWVHYLSIFKYPYEALLANEYNHLPGVIWYDNMDSDAILSSVALGKVHIWNNVVILIVFTIVYRLLFYTSLRFNTRNLRK